MTYYNNRGHNFKRKGKPQYPLSFLWVFQSSLLEGCYVSSKVQEQL